MDFSYFKVSDAQEKKINANPVSTKEQLTEIEE